MSNLALTGLRRSMVLATLRQPRAGHYIVQDVCDLRHSLDPERLRRAWADVAARHEILRSRVVFSTATGEPSLEETPAPPDWDFHDFRDFPESECEAALTRILTQQYARGFDLARDPGPPYRFTIIRNRDDWWTIVWTSHHVLLDGRSYLRVWQKWMSAYDGVSIAPEQAVAADQPPAVTPADLEFWRAELQGLDPEAGALRDPLRASAAGHAESAIETGREIRELSDAGTARLRDLGVRMSTLVASAWATLLARHGQRDDVLFGVTSSGRRSRDQRVGYFIHTIPLRLRPDPQQTLSEWLANVETRTLEARAHEHVPLTSIFPPSANRPFDTLVAYDHQSPGDAFAQLDPRRSLRRFQRTDMPLTLAAYGGTANRLRLEIVYSRADYSPVYAASLADQLETILTGWGESDGPLQRLPFLPELQQTWLQQHAAGPTVPFDTALAHQLIEARARTHPDLPALEDRQRQVLTFHELNARANRLAWRLIREHGVRPGDVVVLQLPRGAAAVLATIAALKSGAACLPIDPAQPEERMRAMLEAASPRVILTGADAAGFPEENPAIEVDPESVAYLIFTSGSTGIPKTVALPHRALVNHSLAVAQVYGIRPGDRRLQFASPGADVFFAEVFIYLSAGVALICCLEPAGPPTFEQYTNALAERRITITGIPASWWKEWMRAFAAAHTSRLPETLRIMICGMERVDASALQQWREVSGGRVRLFNAYGPAENSPTSLIYEFGSSAWEDDHWAPVGKPLANTTAYVLDLAGDDVVPMGVTGEIHLGGRGLALGYQGHGAAVAEQNRRFFTHPRFGLLYRTGDLGFRMPDGNIVFLGRRDLQVKVRGHRIEPEEVEAALRKHPAVREAAVALHPESGELLAWFTRNAETVDPTLHELRAHCAQLLPKAMIPSGFSIVDAMPRGTGGKLDRKALLQIPATRLRVDVEFREPASPAEIQLGEIWKSILHIERVGLDDDFFDLGADSLNSTMLIAAIANSFGVSLELPDILRHSRLAAMAQLCETPASSPIGDSLIALQPRGHNRPIVALCSTEEDLHAFRNLAGFLPAAQPLYLLNCPVNPQASVETIESQANRAAALLARHLPARSYLLAGFCYAGVVAFETVRQLDPARRPEKLLFFDVFRPGSSALPLEDPRSLVDLLRKSASAFSLRELPSHWRFASDLVKRRLRARSDAMTVASGSELPPAPEGGLLEWLERSAAMYQPEEMSTVPVTQFVSRDFEITTRVFEDPRLAWRALCPAGFAVHEVPGAHGTLFQGHNAAALAESLLRVLGLDSRWSPPPGSLP